MKYLPTLNLWTPSVHNAIRNGQIKLQRGQWLRCGTEGKRCRFVGFLNGRKPSDRSIWVAHWQGSSTATNNHFLNCVDAYTERNAR